MTNAQKKIDALKKIQEINQSITPSSNVSTATEEPAQALAPNHFSSIGVQEFGPGTVEKSRSLWGDLKQRGADFIEAVKPEKSARGFSKIITGEKVLQTAGPIAGAINDIIGHALGYGAHKVWQATPEAIKAPIQQKFEEAVKSPLAQDGLKELQKGMDAYEKWGAKNPNGKKDVDAALQLLMLSPTGEAAEGGGIIAKGAGAAAKGVETKLGEQVAKEAVEATAQKVTTKTAEEALSRGLVEEGMSGSKIVASEFDKKVAKSVENVIKDAKTPAERIKAVNGAIEEESKAVEKFLTETPARGRNQATVKKFLDSAKKESSVLFKADKTKEKAYDAIRDTMLGFIKEEGYSPLGIWKARKKFDSFVKTKFPTVFKEAGNNLERNAIQDMRRSTNDLIVDMLGDKGQVYKDFLESTFLKKTAAERMSETGAAALKAGKITNLQKVNTFLKENPIAQWAGLFGISHFAPVLTVPGIAALSAYSTYKIGKKIFTSKAVKEGLMKALQAMEQGAKAYPTLTPVKFNALKDSVQSMIDLLDEENNPQDQPEGSEENR